MQYQKLISTQNASNKTVQTFESNIVVVDRNRSRQVHLLINLNFPNSTIFHSSMARMQRLGKKQLEQGQIPKAKRYVTKLFNNKISFSDLDTTRKCQGNVNLQLRAMDVTIATTFLSADC